MKVNHLTKAKYLTSNLSDIFFENDFMDTPFYKLNLYKEVTGKEINKHSNNEIFYKCMNENMIHNHFKYNFGQNIDTNKFNPHGKCSKGGLYVTNSFNIHNFLHYGTQIGDIVIPDDAKCYLEEGRFKCDKINLILMEQIKDHFVIKQNIKNIFYCIQMVQTNASFIKYIDDDTLKHNVIICIEAVKNCGFSIQHINKEILRNNISICIEAVRNNGHAIKYIDKEILENNVNICMEAVKQNGGAIQYIDTNILLKNVDICVESIRQNSSNKFYIDPNLYNYILNKL